MNPSFRFQFTQLNLFQSSNSLKSSENTTKPLNYINNLFANCHFNTLPSNIPILIIPMSWAPSLPRILHDENFPGEKTKKVIKIRHLVKWLKDCFAENHHSLTCLHLFRWRKSGRQWRYLGKQGNIKKRWHNLHRWKMRFSSCFMKISAFFPPLFIFLTYHSHTRGHVYEVKGGFWVYH